MLLEWGGITMDIGKAVSNLQNDFAADYQGWDLLENLEYLLVIPTLSGIEQRQQEPVL